MEISTEIVKALREKTGISVMQCRKALEEAGGDEAKALEILALKSKDIAGKKFDRTFGAGAVQAYIHSNKEIGAMVTLSCETDFVSKNEEFVKLAYDIALHAAALRPQYIRREDIPEDKIAKIKESLLPEVEGKPEAMKEKILEGKLGAFLANVVLLEQPFVKDDTKTIKNLLDAAVQKFGERTDVTNLSVFTVR